MKREQHSIFFCILGKDFIGLFNGILHFFILLVYPEKPKEILFLLNFICPPLYVCIFFACQALLIHINFLGIVKENYKCRKCSLLGTENSFCNATSGKCNCKDGYFGDSCERKSINLNLNFQGIFPDTGDWFWHLSYS